GPAAARPENGAARVPYESTEHTPRDELAETTAHGEVYLRRLRQSQLALSVTALIAFGALFGVLPIALFLLPVLSHVRLLGVPLSDWLLTVPLYPVFLGIGFLYARRADALDESFRELVRRR
ncbi:MAG: hypothetical protein ACYCX7_11845, partial [Solirubrobacteraceae bacterium]